MEGIVSAAAQAASIANRANQLNPCHVAYWTSRGLGTAAAVTAAAEAGKGATAAVAGATIGIGGAVGAVLTGAGWVYTAYGAYQLGHVAWNWFMG